MGLIQTSQSQVSPLWPWGKPANHRSHLVSPAEPGDGLRVGLNKKNNDENAGSNIGLLHFKYKMLSDLRYLLYACQKGLRRKCRCRLHRMIPKNRVKRNSCPSNMSFIILFGVPLKVAFPSKISIILSRCQRTTGMIVFGRFLNLVKFENSALLKDDTFYMSLRKTIAFTYFSMSPTYMTYSVWAVHSMYVQYRVRAVKECSIWVLSY